MPIFASRSSSPTIVRFGQQTASIESISDEDYLALLNERMGKNHDTA